MEEFNIGLKVMKYRKEKALTLRELAEKSDISASMLSQIESNRVNPSINTLKAIAAALKVPMYQFFRPAAKDMDKLVVRKGNNRIIGSEGTEVCYKLLTNDVSGDIEFCLMEIPAGESSTSIPREHVGEETAYIISGETDIYVNDILYHLNEGDSIKIPGQSPHMWVNRSEAMVKVIFAVSPPSF